jgi:hypothetical protein
MNIGDIVKFKEPEDAQEAAVRFVVAELRGDRVEVILVCDLPLPPRFVYLTADLEN